MSSMDFVWDDTKAKKNEQKHNVTFQEASTIFNDELALTGYDLDHSEAEDRFLTMGVSYKGRLLVVAHTDRGEYIRIISARSATRKERKFYEEG